MVLRSRSRIKGTVSAKVITMDAEGLLLMKELRRRWGHVGPGENAKEVRDGYRRHPVYLKERAEIYAAHSHQKLRTTWNLTVFWVMLQCFIRGKLDKVAEVWKYEYAISHNIVTDEGDALIADHMSETDARTLVDNTNGHIAVGTGWTGTTPKQNTATNTPTGSPEIMDATYPKLKGAWAAANDNIVQYRATFEAGDLNVNGIDEASLGNNAVEATADLLAYGQISPAVDVGAADTLQVDWEHTYLGS